MEIRSDAIIDCTSLQDIDIDLHPAVKSIKYRAFSRCPRLTNVYISEGLEEIGKMAFRECILLCIIDIPPTVRANKDYAFMMCVRFSTVN